MAHRPASETVPLRVLLLHNRYRAAGGEERSVAEIEALLSARGHRVEVLERASADVSRVGAAGALLRGGEDPRPVANAVSRLGADVIHAHNVHPRLGHRALAAAREAGAAVVLHLHNFRLSCAIGVAYRDGAPCFECHGRDTWPGVRHVCRGSHAEALAYAAGLAAHRPALVGAVDRFVAVSASTRARVESLGLPPGGTDVVPNVLAPAAFASRSAAGSGEYALVVSRLTEEKGIDTAIAAARGAGAPLRIAGDGPDLDRLRSLAAGADVTFLGRVEGDELAAARAGAAFALAPSRWEEPCPFAVLEAMAAGLPVLVSDRGGLPELLPGGEDPLPAVDTGAWERAARSLWRDPAARERAGERTLEHARQRFSREAIAPALEAAYARALATRRRDPTRPGAADAPHAPSS